MRSAMFPKILARSEGRVKMPVSCSVGLPEFIFTDIFGCDNQLSNEKFIEIVEPIGKRYFSRGSYALVVPPMRVADKEEKQKIRISFCYQVYNDRDELQWPDKSDLPIRLE